MTIKEIAQLAQVSSAAVSRYLNGGSVSEEKKERIREVMRFSGPRMMLYHPVMALSHMVSSMKEKKKLKGES